jgi:hypothetical protein
MANAKAPLEDIARAILVLRGHRVLLDSDISALYGVATKAQGVAMLSVDAEAAGLDLEPWSQELASDSN